MRKNIHQLDMTRLVESASWRRNLKVLDARAAQQARSEADTELLGLLLAYLVAVTAVLVVWSWQFGWWD